MLQCGTSISQFDPAVFFIYEGGVLKGVVAVHVDNFMWSGCKEFEERVVTKLREIFQVGKEESISFKFLGLELKSDKEKIFLSQNQYITYIQPVVLSKLRRQSKDNMLTDIEQKSLRSLIGQILWASSETRPDVAFKACLASILNGSTVQTVLDANKVVQQLITEPVNI